MLQSGSLIVNSLCGQGLMNANCILVSHRRSSESSSELENNLYLFESTAFPLAGQLVPRWDGRSSNCCSIVPEGNHTRKLHVVQLQVCYCLYITKLGLEDELRTTVLRSKVEMKCVGKERPCAGK